MPDHFKCKTVVGCSLVQVFGLNQLHNITPPWMYSRHDIGGFGVRSITLYDTVYGMRSANVLKSKVIYMLAVITDDFDGQSL
jgi:hypothetical protein